MPRRVGGGQVVLPSSEHIASRVIVHLAISLRAGVVAAQRERGAVPKILAERGLTSLTDAAKAVQGWARSQVPKKFVSESDRACLFESASGLSVNDPHDLQWNVECAEMFAWALRVRRTLPAFDVAGFDARSPLRKLILAEDAWERVIAPGVREEDTVWEARVISHAWTWRAHVACWDAAFEAGLLSPQARFWRARARKALARIVRQARAKKWFNPIEGDFPVRGQAYCCVGRDGQVQLQKIAENRSASFKWLVGTVHDWDRVSADDWNVIPPVSNDR